MTPFHSQPQTSTTVTPTKWRGDDGIVYERTGERRTPEPGELHWCDSTQAAPYPFEWPAPTSWNPRESWPPEGWQTTDPGAAQYMPLSERPCINCGRSCYHHLDRRPNRLPFDTYPPPENSQLECPQVHVCAIWQKSEDQEWQPRELETIADPVDRLFQEMEYPDNPGRIAVLAALHQVKALQRIAAALEKRNSFIGPPFPVVTACLPCSLAEHGQCTVKLPGPQGVTQLCPCPVCNCPPQIWGTSEYPAPPSPHGFEGMEDNHYCTRCGAGRLHEIHQLENYRGH